VTIDAAGHRASYSSVPEKLAEHDLTLWDFVIQPSTFWTRRAWERVGKLDEGLHYSLDWDWFIRAKKAGVEFIGTERALSVYRIHAAHKSGSGDKRREQELALVYERHHGAGYGAAYLRASERKAEIQGVTRRLKKWRMEGQTVRILRMRFPGVFAQLTDREAGHLLAML
jgi:GT2 family glycosyltransferase